MKQTRARRAKAVQVTKRWKAQNRVRVAEQRNGVTASRPKPATCEACDREGGDGLGKNPKPLHFDHCHRTGIFRGWLCQRCNWALGFVGDSPATLRALADYLETSELL